MRPITGLLVGQANGIFYHLRVGFAVSSPRLLGIQPPLAMLGLKLAVLKNPMGMWSPGTIKKINSMILFLSWTRKQVYVINFMCHCLFLAVQATASRRVWLLLLVVMDQHRNQSHVSSIPHMNFYRKMALRNNSTLNIIPNV